MPVVALFKRPVARADAAGNPKRTAARAAAAGNSDTDDTPLPKVNIKEIMQRDIAERCTTGAFFAPWVGDWAEGRLGQRPHQWHAWSESLHQGGLRSCENLRTVYRRHVDSQREKAATDGSG